MSVLIYNNSISCLKVFSRAAFDAMSPERKTWSLSFDEIVFNAKEIILKDGMHVPTIIVEGNKNLIAGQVRDMPYTHGERVELMRFLGQATARSGKIQELRQVFMISEGWLSVPKDGETENLRPSQDPDRKEVLIVSGIKIQERKKQIKALEIVRDGDSRVSRLEEFLPDAKENETIDIPLLDAFVWGFQMAFRARNT